jgi:two-component system sensor histidine kinase DesK
MMELMRSKLPWDGTAAAAAPSEATPDGALGIDTNDRWSRGRVVVIRILCTFFLITPFFSTTGGKLSTAQIAFLVPATLVLIVMINWWVIGLRRPMPLPMAWTVMLAAIGFAIAVLAVGGLNWIGATFLAGAAAGRVSASGRVAGIGGVLCAAGALGVGVAQGVDYGSALELGLGPPLATFFAYSAARRSELVYKLQETRAELARMAVAEERLRIARDLHDLLGHSLSLITIKAELAGRVIDADPARAATEITDVEHVARRSLGEVRAAVTSYRQPSLASELAAARQMLTAAGMDGQVHMPDGVELSPATEGLLAWTVREGATNAVRHSGARAVTITVSVTESGASAEVADDGVGPSWDAGRDPGERGSGLAGLAERARSAGGEISAGEGRAGKGFRLLVRVPT